MGFLSKFFGGDAGAPASKPGSASSPEARELEPLTEAAETSPEPPPAPAAGVAAAVSTSKDELTVRVGKLAKQGLPDKDTPAAPEATPKVPAAPAAAAKPAAPAAAPGATKAVTVAGKGVAPAAPIKLAAGGAAAKLGASAPVPLADKPPAGPFADKPVARADKPPVPAAAPAAAEKLAATAAARGVPPERRRALEDSVVTSAPKLPGDASQRGAPAARPTVKGVAKTSPAQPPAKGTERASGDKLASAVSDPSSVPGFRQRRDHSKSPGFYSTVAPEHAGDAVAAGPFAPVPQKKPTVVGLAPPPEPSKLAVPGPTEPAGVEDARPGALPLAPPLAAQPAEVEIAAADEPDLLSALVPMAADDAFAPPQPCSTPPGSVAPLARQEKEETSPGLGHARSLHDPNLASQVSGTDLELLLSFALDLALGCVSEAWFVPLRAAVGRLLAGDAALRNASLEKALTTLANDLEQPGAFKEENRQRLYGHVVAVDLALSKRMDVTGQKAIRERLIVDQLLEELAQSHPMLPRRLKDQGLVSLEGLGRLTAVDLSAKLETPPDTAAQVAGIFQGYLAARVQRGPAVALLGKSVALQERISALEASAEAFDRASEGEDSGARRRTRKQRQTDVTQLNLLLAEFGEAKTLAEIERCSVQAKIERMQRWIGDQEASSGRRASKISSAP